jgi:Ca2+-binding RTX toxin-like protein
MPTLTVTATTDYRFLPNSNLVTGQNITDIVFSAPGAGGTIITSFLDTQFGGSNISNAVTITGGDDREFIQISFTGSAANFSAAGWTLVSWSQDDRIDFIGTSEGDTFVGSSGLDALSGQNGDDSISGDGGNDLLIGGAGADTLRGDAGDDNLTGGAGNDSLIGGAGADIAGFNVSTPMFVDLVQGIATGEGTDTLVDIENIETNIGADTISGNSADNVFNASDGANQLFGLGGNDTLLGGASNDVLDGGTGIDSMIGAAGDDTYIVDNVGDIVSELFSIWGYDTVFTTVDYTLPTYAEQLVMQGAAVNGTGSGINNYLYGGLSGHSLRLDGDFGDDILYASLAGGNTLLGGNGNDTLLIYGGNNIVDGGAGDDVYYSYSATDSLSEFSLLVNGGGYDTVFANWNITLGANLDQLVLFGAASVAVGNAANNIIYGNGTSGAVNLFGMDGADVLYGGAGFDTLSGGNGNDQLFGLGGINTLYGGADSDIYYFAGVAGTIVENANEGFDTVYTNVAYTMADNTEQLIQYGSGTIFGNAGDNYISAVSATAGVSVNGAAGNDYIFNSDFADTLEGGLGNDQLDMRPNTASSNDFIRYGADGNMGNDTIYGFDSDPTGGQDIISLVGRGYVAGSIGTSITIAQAGTHTLVSFTAGSLAGTTLLFFNLGSANMTAGDFLF